MGSGYVLTREGNRSPSAIVQAVRGEKQVQRYLRFEGVLRNKHESFLKKNGNIAPSIHDLKKLVGDELEYGEGQVSSLISQFYCECSLGRNPFFKIEKRVYIIPK